VLCFVGKLQLSPAAFSRPYGRTGTGVLRGPNCSILLWSVFHVFRDVSVNIECHNFHNY
jgi:hypothetical protein